MAFNNHSPLPWEHHDRRAGTLYHGDIAPLRESTREPH